MKRTILLLVICVSFNFEILGQVNLDSISNLSLTEAHRAWLEQHKSINLGVSPAFAPFQFWNSQENYSGMVSDYVRLLNERLDISMEPFPNLTWAQIISAAYEGRIDVVPGIVKTPERAEKLLFTEPFLSIPIVVIANTNFRKIKNIKDLEGARIAIIRKAVAEYYLNQDLAQFNPVYVEDIFEALKVVSEGKADVIIENKLSFEDAQLKLGLSNFKVVATTPYMYELSIAVRKDWPELVQILEIGLSEISDSERTLIKEKWTNIEIRKEIDWGKMALWSSGIILVSLTIVALIVKSNRKLAREIKSRKITEEKLKTAKNMAEKTLKDLQGTQDQLIQSEKMASLGHLTAGIAHELNNPINFISNGNVGLKRDMEDIVELLDKYEHLTNDSDQQKVFEDIAQFKQDIDFDFLKENITQTLDDIKMGADRTTEIVKGLRSFSRLDTETQVLANIHTGIDDTLTILNTKLNNKVEVIKQYDERIGDVLCYPGRLNQVFMNLIVNAEQAIIDRGVITISTEKLDGEIRISIKDDGLGMSKEVRQHIFDPFYTTKNFGDGVGLGMSISYGIIKKHKGSISVKSETGKGAEFIITLPINTRET